MPQTQLPPTAAIAGLHLSRLCPGCLSLARHPEGSATAGPGVSAVGLGTLSLRHELIYVIWLVVTGTWLLFFHIIENNHPNWLIFFRGVETTNQFWFMMIPLMFPCQGWFDGFGDFCVLALAFCQDNLRSTIVSCKWWETRVLIHGLVDPARSYGLPCKGILRLTDVDSRWSQRTLWIAAFGNVWYTQWLANDF